MVFPLQVLWFGFYIIPKGRAGGSFVFNLHHYTGVAVMLDITNNYYWVDETGKPLSVLEIREHIANQEFCTPVTPDDNLKELQKSLQRNYENFLYIAKNMVYMYYCTNNSLGETENFYIIMPKNCVLNESAPLILVSKESIESSPFEK